MKHCFYFIPVFLNIVLTVCMAAMEDRPQIEWPENEHNQIGYLLDGADMEEDVADFSFLDDDHFGMLELDLFSDISERMVQENQACPCGFKAQDKEILKSHLYFCQAFHAEQELLVYADEHITPDIITNDHVDEIVTCYAPESMTQNSYTKQLSVPLGRGRPPKYLLHKNCACGLMFDDAKYLVQHMREKHRGLDRQFYCPVVGCDKKVHTLSIMVMLDHFVSEHTHEKVEFICNICKKIFGYHQSLQIHKRDHIATGCANHKKRNAEKMETYDANQSAGQQKERKVKKIAKKVKKQKISQDVCRITKKRRSREIVYTQCACGQVFSHGQDLVEHVKQAHSKKIRNKTFYICPVENCKKKASSDMPYSLDHFAFAHTFEKVKIKCKYCEEQCSSYRHLQIHEVTHKAEKQELIRNNIIQKVCACGMSFPDGYQLMEHIKVAHVIKKNNKTFYVCPASPSHCPRGPIRDLKQILGHFATMHPGPK